MKNAISKSILPDNQNMTNDNIYFGNSAPSTAGTIEAGTLYIQNDTTNNGVRFLQKSSNGWEQVSVDSIEVTVSGTDPVITAEANTRYICGEVTTLSFTPPASGICEVIFTSGSLATVLTLPATVKMPEWFEVETNHTYEISVLNGVYGGVMSWPTA